MIYRVFLLAWLLALAACSAEPAVDEAPPVAQPPVSLPSTSEGQQTTVEPVTEPAAAGDAGVVYGRTDDGAFFHGAPDAPVTLIDYSDFL